MKGVVLSERAKGNSVVIEPLWGMTPNHHTERTHLSLCEPTRAISHTSLSGEYGDVPCSVTVRGRVPKPV